MSGVEKEKVGVLWAPWKESHIILNFWNFQIMLLNGVTLATKVNLPIVRLALFCLFSTQTSQKKMEIPKNKKKQFFRQTNFILFLLDCSVGVQKRIVFSIGRKKGGKNCVYPVTDVKSAVFLFKMFISASSKQNQTSQEKKFKTTLEQFYDKRMLIMPKASCT
jgi:hypothetical protein